MGVIVLVSVGMLVSVACFVLVSVGLLVGVSRCFGL